MIFKANATNLSVYDPKSESFIATFVGGRFETQDESLIARLIELEYKPEAEVKQEMVVDEPIEKPKRGRPKVEK